MIALSDTMIRHLRGDLTLEQAAEIGRADTRHYAKRQFTWFRHQLSNANFIAPDTDNMKFSESSLRKIFQNIRDFGLTVL